MLNSKQLNRFLKPYELTPENGMLNLSKKAGGGGSYFPTITDTVDFWHELLKLICQATDGVKSPDVLARLVMEAAIRNGRKCYFDPDMSMAPMPMLDSRFVPDYKFGLLILEKFCVVESDEVDLSTVDFNNLPPVPLSSIDMPMPLPLPEIDLPPDLFSLPMPQPDEWALTPPWEYELPELPLPPIPEPEPKFKLHDRVKLKMKMVFSGGDVPAGSLGVIATLENGGSYVRMEDKFFIPENRNYENCLWFSPGNAERLQEWLGHYLELAPLDKFQVGTRVALKNIATCGGGNIPAGAQGVIEVLDGNDCYVKMDTHFSILDATKYNSHANCLRYASGSDSIQGHLERYLVLAPVPVIPEPDPLNVAGKKSLDAGDFWGALVSLRDWCRDNPRDAEARFNLALANYLYGKKLRDDNAEEAKLRRVPDYAKGVCEMASAIGIFVTALSLDTKIHPIYSAWKESLPEKDRTLVNIQEREWRESIEDDEDDEDDDDEYEEECDEDDDYDDDDLDDDDLDDLDEFEDDDDEEDEEFDEDDDDEEDDYDDDDDEE